MASGVVQSWSLTAIGSIRDTSYIDCHRARSLEANVGGKLPFTAHPAARGFKNKSQSFNSKFASKPVLRSWRVDMACCACTAVENTHTCTSQKRDPS